MFWWILGSTRFRHKEHPTCDGELEGLSITRPCLGGGACLEQARCIASERSSSCRCWRMRHSTRAARVLDHLHTSPSLSSRSADESCNVQPQHQTLSLQHAFCSLHSCCKIEPSLSTGSVFVPVAVTESCPDRLSGLQQKADDRRGRASWQPPRLTDCAISNSRGPRSHDGAVPAC